MLASTRSASVRWLASTRLASVRWLSLSKPTLLQENFVDGLLVDVQSIWERGRPALRTEARGGHPRSQMLYLNGYRFSRLVKARLHLCAMIAATTPSVCQTLRVGTVAAVSRVEPINLPQTAYVAHPTRDC